MIQHLKIFLGTSEQLLNHYMIRFTEPGYVEFIATDGHFMCVNRVQVMHDLIGVTYAVSPDEFAKVLMLYGGSLNFLIASGKLVVYGSGLTLPIKTLDPDNIPDLNAIFNRDITDTATHLLNVVQLKKIVEYCGLIDDPWFKIEFTGDHAPITIRGDNDNWKIVFIPMERR